MAAAANIAVADQCMYLLCVAESRKYPAYQDARVGYVQFSVGGGVRGCPVLVCSKKRKAPSPPVRYSL